MGSRFLLGMLLLGLGMAALGYQGVSYTSREWALNRSGLELATETTTTLPLLPAAGVAALVCGSALVTVSTGKSREV